MTLMSHGSGGNVSNDGSTRTIALMFFVVVVLVVVGSLILLVLGKF